MSNSRRVSGGGFMASSLLAVDRILQKENNYREGIATNQATSKMLAEAITLNGNLETSMLQACSDDASKQDVQGFLEEQRERLKKVAEKNVQNSRDVDAFVASLQAVRAQVQSTPVTADPLDYERIIQDKMQQYQASRSGPGVDNDKFLKDIREALGEKESAAARGDNDSDEELEILRPLGGGGVQSLKCPITAMLFEQPVKNRVCGHVYSKAGIQSVLKSGPRRCPVAGCGNRGVSMDQLEDDVEMSMKVKRQRRREENERLQRASQLDDSDDEDVL